MLKPLDVCHFGLTGRGVLVVVTVVTGAGVLQIVTGRAIGEVQIELLAMLGAVGLGDIDDDGKIASFRQGLSGKEDVAVSLEAEFGWITPVPRNCGNRLVADGFDLEFLGYLRDTHSAVFGDEKLKMGFDSGEDSPAIGSGNDALVIVVVLMTFLFMGMFTDDLFFVRMVVVFVLTVFAVLMTMIVVVMDPNFVLIAGDDAVKTDENDSDEGQGLVDHVFEGGRSVATSLGPMQRRSVVPAGLEFWPGR